jgi:uncharacterized protein
MPSSIPLTLWALCDNRAGNTSQTMGLAQAMENLGSTDTFRYLAKHLNYTSWVRLPNLIRQDWLLGLDRDSKQQLTPPWPDMVIATGRRLASVSLWIKKQSPNTRLIHILSPEIHLSKFDRIILPTHDRPRHAPNIITSVGALHGLTPARIEAAMRDIPPPLPLPCIGLMIGGGNRHSGIQSDIFLNTLKSLVARCQERNLSIWATTSRRTPADLLTLIKGALSPIPHTLWQWGDSTPNPYPSLLGYATALAVTDDSISMTSESLSLGKPVFILPLLKKPSFLLFFNDIYQKNLAMPWTGTWMDQQPTPLQETQRIAEILMPS